MSFVIYQLLGLSFWGEHEGIWYVDFFIPLYFITRLLAYLIDKTKHRIVATTIQMLACFTVSILLVCNFLKDILIFIEVLQNIQSILCRVLSFIQGYFSAKYIMNKKRMSLQMIFVLILIFIGLSKIPYVNLMYQGESRDINDALNCENSSK